MSPSTGAAKCASALTPSTEQAQRQAESALNLAIRQQMEQQALTAASMAAQAMGQKWTLPTPPCHVTSMNEKTDDTTHG